MTNMPHFLNGTSTQVQRQSLFDNQNLLEVLFCSRNQNTKANALRYTNHLNTTVTYRCSYEASSCFRCCSASADICFLIPSTSSIRWESISSFCSRSADATARLIYELWIKEKPKQVTTPSTSSVSENGAIIKVIPSPTLPFDIQFMGNSKYYRENKSKPNHQSQLIILYCFDTHIILLILFISFVCVLELRFQIFNLEIQHKNLLFIAMCHILGGAMLLFRFSEFASHQL